jgi:hypothetical protein
MKVARLYVAALMSSCALLMFSLAINSSRILTLFLFSAILSFEDGFVVESETVEGILSRRRGGGGILCDKKFQNGAKLSRDRCES